MLGHLESDNTLAIFRPFSPTNRDTVPRLEVSGIHTSLDGLHPVRWEMVKLLLTREDLETQQSRLEEKNTKALEDISQEVHLLSEWTSVLEQADISAEVTCLLAKVDTH